MSNLPEHILRGRLGGLRIGTPDTALGETRSVAVDAVDMLVVTCAALREIAVAVAPHAPSVQVAMKVWDEATSALGQVSERVLGPEDDDDCSPDVPPATEEGPSRDPQIGLAMGTSEERMKGLEPSTFCMASESGGEKADDSSVEEPANLDYLVPGSTGPDRPQHAGLDLSGSLGVPPSGDRPVWDRPIWEKP